MDELQTLEEKSNNMTKKLEEQKKLLVKLHEAYDKAERKIRSGYYNDKDKEISNNIKDQIHDSNTSTT